jgi:hypothetical protein
MRFAKRLLMGVGAVALTAMLVSLAAPRAVHAVVAALVQVTNTPANPVPVVDLSKSAAQNIELVCIDTSPYPCFLVPPTGTIDLTTLTAWTVPAGTNFVITDVEINTEVEMDGVTATFFGVLWTPPDSSPQRGDSWTVTNGPTAEFTFPSGIVVASGSTITGKIGPDVISGTVRGYLAPY